jgi:hypothetical protein
MRATADTSISAKPIGRFAMQQTTPIDWIRMGTSMQSIRSANRRSWHRHDPEVDRARNRRCATVRIVRIVRADAEIEHPQRA